MPVDVVTPPEHLPTFEAPSSPAALAFDPAASPEDELARQVQVYVDLRFPQLLGQSEEEFRDSLVPLCDRVADVAAKAADQAGPGPDDDRVPFVLVLADAPPNDVVPAMRLGTRTGFSVIDDEEARTYRTIDAVDAPDGAAYLLGGVDVGSTYLSVTPETALAAITQAGRTPLTIAEGLALVVLRPDMLRPNRCFSLAGSRTGTNQRVPAIWISQRRPKLGWCWDRNPHTWLGTASASVRQGAAPA
ncbi:DUF5701 family protein [Georgenia faecalis]|uniref:DUF5701 family protein n=1 Tax=Georgenia faecalis TaxID=2483799 RepID=UPI0019D01A0B|nr:DUF5701 family protein [Georgenia faecalis]